MIEEKVKKGPGNMRNYQRKMSFIHLFFSDKDSDDDNKAVFIVFRMGDILVCL